MENVHLNQDYRSELSRWVKLQELITTYDPQCRVKRSIIQNHDVVVDASIESRICSLKKLSKIPDKDILQILSPFIECSNIILANYGAANNSNPDLRSGLDDHIRKLWDSYFPKINPAFGSIPTDIQVNILLILIKTEPENRLVIRQVIVDALFSQEI